MNLENQQQPEIKTETKPLIRQVKGDGKNVILGITGTSGSIYGLRILRALLMNSFNVDLILTEYASFTLYKECGVELKQSTLKSVIPDVIHREESVIFRNNLDLKSEMFSTNYETLGMIVSPCAMNYVSGIANGESKNLIEKSADHLLSFSKPVIIVPRETPLNKIQLKNLLTIADAGGKIVPAMAPYDFNPGTFSDLADYIAGRVIDMLVRVN
jgi:4-hydroxy-3-polyprenylbenzoate decarboxylase